MKDARGHGSNGSGSSSTRADFARNKIAMVPGATFAKAGEQGLRTRAQITPSTSDRVADLRARMQANSGSPGHLAALAQGLKNLVGL